MFFRRVPPHIPTFEERVERAKQAGFQAAGGAAAVRLSRDGFAADVTGVPQDRPHVSGAGLLVGEEIAHLVDGGFQKFWMTSSGQRLPALAAQLRPLHDFEEDLKEALGLESLYNESLGTCSDWHIYDRVRDRDGGVPRRAWQR